MNNSIHIKTVMETLFFPDARECVGFFASLPNVLKSVSKGRIMAFGNLVNKKARAKKDKLKATLCFE